MRAFRIFTALAVFLYSTLYFTASASAAACDTTPTEVTLGACTTAGQWDYDTVNNTYRYCNGTNYISLKSATTLGACPGVKTATLEYNTGSDVLMFCDGTNWVAFSDSGIEGACANAGQINFDTNTNHLTFCQAGGLVSVRETETNLGSVEESTNTAWRWTGDGMGSFDSGAYNNLRTITITNNGTCDLDITNVSVTPPNDCAASGFPICGGVGTGFVIRDTSTCAGALAAGDSCTIDMIGQIVIPAGGVVNVSGTLSIQTSTMTQDISLQIFGCDEIGGDANICS